MQASELLNTYHVDVNTWDEMYGDAPMPGLKPVFPLMGGWDLIQQIIAW
jgi:hypothetical protein